MPVKKNLSWRNVVLAGLCLGRLQSRSEGRCEVNIIYVTIKHQLLE